MLKKVFFLIALLTLTLHAVLAQEATPEPGTIQEFDVPRASHPHDVAPAPDGSVWYTSQFTGELGKLDPATGEITLIPLGNNSSPHGVIVGPDGAPWITDSGLNAIVRVDPETEEVTVFALPIAADANLNTAVFAPDGILWFTGQNGYYGRVDPETAVVEVFESPRGRGPYGITTTPDGLIFYASLAGSHIAQIDTETGEATPIDPPTGWQGARRVWSDSEGKIWVSEYNAGQVAVYDPATGEWQEWELPGTTTAAYAVYVDACDRVWLSDFGQNSIVMFDPETEAFTSYPLANRDAAVRQILGRPGEIWGAESSVDKLIVIYTDC